MTSFDWKRIDLFAQLADPEIERVKPLFSLIEAPAGERLINEGDFGDEMYILVKGRVRVTKAMLIKGVALPLPGLEDPRKVLATLDGAVFPIFGEMALLDRDARSATVETLEPCRFLVATRESFFALIRAEPALGLHLTLNLARRLASTVRKNNSELVKLTTALALALSHHK